MSASCSGRLRGVPCGHSDARQLRRDRGGTARSRISRWTGRRRGDPLRWRSWPRRLN